MLGKQSDSFSESLNRVITCPSSSSKDIPSSIKKMFTLSINIDGTTIHNGQKVKKNQMLVNNRDVYIHKMGLFKLKE